MVYIYSCNGQTSFFLLQSLIMVLIVEVLRPQSEYNGTGRTADSRATEHVAGRSMGPENHWSVPNGQYTPTLSCSELGGEEEMTSCV